MTKTSTSRIQCNARPRVTHEELMKSKIAMVSGWATGGVILYIPFARELNLSTGYIFIIDSLLSIFLFIFSMITVAAFSTALQAVSTEDNTPDNPGWFVTIQRVIMVLGLIIGGLLLLQFSSSSIEASKTAAVLGAMMAGSGILATSMAVRRYRKV